MCKISENSIYFEMLKKKKKKKNKKTKGETRKIWTLESWKMAGLWERLCMIEGVSKVMPFFLSQRAGQILVFSSVFLPSSSRSLPSDAYFDGCSCIKTVHLNIGKLDRINEVLARNRNSLVKSLSRKWREGPSFFRPNFYRYRFFSSLLFLFLFFFFLQRVTPVFWRVHWLTVPLFTLLCPPSASFVGKIKIWLRKRVPIRKSIAKCVIITCLYIQWYIRKI